MNQIVPHWLVQGMDSFSNTQTKQSLEWAMRNYQGKQLAKAYEFANYFRPAYSRDNQFLVDRMGEMVYNQGALAGNVRTGVTSMGSWYDPTQMVTDAVKSDQEKKAAQKGEAGVWDFMSELMKAPAEVVKAWSSRQPGSQSNPGGWTGQGTPPNPQDFLKFGEDYRKWAATAANTPVRPPQTRMPSWALPVGIGLAAVATAAILASR